MADIHNSEHVSSLRERFISAMKGRVACGMTDRGTLGARGELADILLEVLYVWRDEYFGPGNDKVWGPGNWVRCIECPDGTGLPSYHHREAHPGREAQP